MTNRFPCALLIPETRNNDFYRRGIDHENLTESISPEYVPDFIVIFDNFIIRRHNLHVLNKNIKRIVLKSRHQIRVLCALPHMNIARLDRVPDWNLSIAGSIPVGSTTRKGGSLTEAAQHKYHIILTMCLSILSFHIFLHDFLWNIPSWKPLKQGELWRYKKGVSPMY